MEPSDATLFAGIIIGSLMVITVLYVYIRHERFGPTGWVLTCFGLLFLGLSIWTGIQINFDPKQGLMARFEKLKQEVEELKETELTIKEPNKMYTADQSGFVLVQIAADPQHRHVAATGLLNNSKVASSAAQDATVEGVPSISSNSFIMPVLKKGMTWKVEVDDKNISNVRIYWFSR